MLIDRWKHTSIKQRAYGVLQGLTEIVDGLVVVLTLGFYASWFSNRAAYMRAMSEINERAKNVRSKNKPR
jgi:hypothetical protein